jgi:hypothetical protein
LPLVFDDLDGFFDKVGSRLNDLSVTLRRCQKGSRIHTGHQVDPVRGQFLCQCVQAFSNAIVLEDIEIVLEEREAEIRYAIMGLNSKRRETRYLLGYWLGAIYQPVCRGYIVDTFEYIQYSLSPPSCEDIGTKQHICHIHKFVEVLWNGRVGAVLRQVGFAHAVCVVIVVLVDEVVSK